MEKKKMKEASCSLLQQLQLLPHHYNSNQPSHDCLHVSLSDLNKRMKKIVTLLEEDGKSSSESHICFKTRPELIQLFEDLDRSYCSLGDKFHHLKSTLPTAFAKSSSFSGIYNNKTLMSMSDDCILENLGSYPFSIADAESDSEYLNKIAQELMLTEQCKMKGNIEHQTMENSRSKEIFCSRQDMNMNMDYFSSSFSKINKCSWSNVELQLSQLIEENLQYQNELARRNIRKKAVIKRLELEVAQLKEENMALQSCLKVGDQLRTSKLRTLFSDKIFQGCS